MTDTTGTDVAVATDTPTLMQKIFAEAVGTFVLVFFGCGSVAIWTAATASGGEFASDGSFDPTGTAIAFGVAVMVSAYAFGRISGGHFNPAVSLGAVLGGRLSWKDFGIYAGVQVAAAIVAAGVLRVLLIGMDDFDIDRSGLATNGFGKESGFAEYAWWSAFVLELILTLVFVLVILTVTDKRNSAVAALAPLAIGFTLVLIHLVAIPATGTSVNPARSIGPALLTFDMDKILQLWLFILAPLIGGAAAGFLYPVLFGTDGEPVPGSGLAGLSSGGGGARKQTQQQWGGEQQWGGQQGGQEQPIIQDGWQWDPASQQWIPAQQAPQQPAAPQAPQQQTPPQQGSGWNPPGGDQTQIRPPQS